MEKVAQSGMVCCADMTKVISAESFITSKFNPDTSAISLSDPNASNDFRDLVDIITNDTKIRFKVSEGAPLQTGVFPSVLLDLTDKTASVTNPPLKQNKTKLHIQYVTNDAKLLNDVFNNYVVKPEIAKKIVHWLKFQLYDSELQKIFWSTNKIGELQESLDAFKTSFGSVLPVRLSSVETIFGNRPYGYAIDHFDTELLSADEFLFSYAYWAFIKGYRYARSLDNDNVYLVHWLREQVTLHSDCAVVRDIKDAEIKVPWGQLIQSLLERFPVDIPLERFTDELIKLRRYTIGSLGNATNPKQRTAFLKDGLCMFLEKMYPTKEGAIKTKNIMEKTEALSKYLPYGKKAMFVLKDVKWILRNIHGKQSIKILISQGGPRVQEFIENG